MSTTEDPSDVAGFCRWLALRWLARRDSHNDSGSGSGDSDDDPVALLLALAPVVLELWFEFTYELAQRHCEGVDLTQRFADILASAGYTAHCAHPGTAARRRKATGPPGRPTQPPRPSGTR